MKKKTHPEDGVSEQAAVVLILILVILLAGVFAAGIFGFLNLTPKTGFLVPKAEMVNISGYQTIRLRDLGGDPFTLNTSAADTGRYRLGLRLDSSAGSQEVRLLPGTKTDFGPGDTVYIFESGTTPVLASSPSLVAPTADFPAGSLVLVLTDETSKVLLSRIVLLQAGGGVAPVPTITPIPASTSLLNAARGGSLAPDGYLEFTVNGLYSWINVSGTIYPISSGDTVRLTLGSDGYGDVYVAPSSFVSAFSFDDVTVTVNGAALATGTIGGIWISGTSGQSSTLTLNVPSSSSGWTQFTTDGTTQVWGDNSQAISITGIKGPANLATTASSVYYDGAVTGYNLG
jgi:FlaG/FlaF family flagellin (archaellin)